MTAGPGRVEVGREGTAATVTWDRPPLHVFDVDLLDRVSEALASREVRTANVVVVRGADHRWSAGFAVEDHFPGRVRAMFAAQRRLLTALEEVPTPVFAPVEGPCLGGGLEILGACDLAFASTSATFGQPEIRLGVFPPVAAALAPAALGPKRAAELLYLGETVPAARALELGLVSRVVPPERLDAEVAGVVARLGTFRRETLRLLKRAVRGTDAVPADRVEFAERLYLDRLLALPDAEEGLRAFLEHRAPSWPAEREEAT